MPRMRNLKHERVAQELANGKSFKDACRIAGLDDDRGNANRVCRRPDVQRRLDELKALDIEFADVTRVKTVINIDRVGRANIADFYETATINGRQVFRLKNILDLPREITAAIKAIKQRDDGSIELELWDKNQANFTLLKYLGGLPDDRPTATNINIFGDLSLDDQQALAAALERQVAHDKGKDKTIDGDAEEVQAAE